MIWRFIVAMMLLTAPASPHDRLALIDVDRGAWFNSLRYQCGKHKCSCCNRHDCKRTTARMLGGHWFALSPSGDAPGALMVPIPDERIIYDPESVDGEAYICINGRGAVRCFVPPKFDAF